MTTPPILPLDTCPRTPDRAYVLHPVATDKPVAARWESDEWHILAIPPVSTVCSDSDFRGWAAELHYLGDDFGKPATATAMNTDVLPLAACPMTAGRLYWLVDSIGQDHIWRCPGRIELPADVFVGYVNYPYEEPLAMGDEP